jgi:hypothetical protein
LERNLSRKPSKRPVKTLKIALRVKDSLKRNKILKTVFKQIDKSGFQYEEIADIAGISGVESESRLLSVGGEIIALHKFLVDREEKCPPPIFPKLDSSKNS